MFRISFIILFSINSSFAQDLKLIAPSNEIELTQSILKLRKKYLPYLRSLPQKYDVRIRDLISENWDFCYEYSDKDNPVNANYGGLYHGVHLSGILRSHGCKHSIIS